MLTFPSTTYLCPCISQFLAYTCPWVIPPIVITSAVEIQTLYKIRNFIHLTADMGLI